MKLKFNSAIILPCLLVITSIACESNQRTTYGAFERFKKDKTASDNNLNIDNKKVVELKDKISTVNHIAEKETVVKKIKSQDDWSKFKIEMESKILANVSKIKKIKDTPNSNHRFYKKVKLLEKNNNELKEELSNCDKEAMSEREKFKLEMNQEVNEIFISLNDMSTVNKK